MAHDARLPLACVLLACVVLAPRAVSSQSRSLLLSKPCVSTTGELIAALASTSAVDGVIDVKLCFGCAGPATNVRSHLTDSAATPVLQHALSQPDSADRHGPRFRLSPATTTACIQLRESDGLAQLRGFCAGRLARRAFERRAHALRHRLIGCRRASFPAHQRVQRCIFSSEGGHCRRDAPERLHAHQSQLVWEWRLHSRRHDEYWLFGARFGPLHLPQQLSSWDNAPDAHCRPRGCHRGASPAPGLSCRLRLT